MAAGATYTPIQTYTLSTATRPIVFSSIPQTYTDLVIVCNPILSGSTNYNFQFYFNADNASTNYSITGLVGDGSSASSYAVTNYAVGLGSAAVTARTTYGSQFNINIMSYANTTTYKTVITRANNAAAGSDANVNVWRSASAINTVTLQSDGGQTFAAGSTFTLYGIAAA